MFMHWATGLRSGLLPQDCGVATSEVGKKTPNLSAAFVKVLIFGARGWISGGFRQVLGGLPHVSYES